MTKYKALSVSVFKIAGTQYNTKEGDILELPSEHITVRALVERGRLELFTDVAEPRVFTEPTRPWSPEPSDAEPSDVADAPEDAAQLSKPKVKPPKK